MVSEQGDQVQEIPLIEIDLQASPQPRLTLDERVIEEYATEMRHGAVFPPVILYRIGDRYLLADGWHRVRAAARAGLRTVRAVVRTGSEDDLYKEALGANATHGLRRSAEDRRRVVELALRRWPTMPDQDIAAICRVQRVYVTHVRRALEQKRVIPRVPFKGRKLVPGDKEYVDCTGAPIPYDALALWLRQSEVRDVLSMLGAVIQRLVDAQRANDPAWLGPNLQAVIMQLRLIRSELELAVPYAVCPVCYGSTITKRCPTCQGKGFINHEQWLRVHPGKTGGGTTASVPGTGH